MTIVITCMRSSGRLAWSGSCRLTIPGGSPFPRIIPTEVRSWREVVVDDGELRAAPPGATLLVAPEVDPGARLELDAWFLSEASVHPSSFRVAEGEVSLPLVVDSGVPNPHRSIRC